MIPKWLLLYIFWREISQRHKASIPRGIDVMDQKARWKSVTRLVGMNYTRLEFTGGMESEITWLNELCLDWRYSNQEISRYKKDNFMFFSLPSPHWFHCIDVIMTTMASQITSLAVVYSSVYLDADQRKHQSSASLAFVWGIHRDRWIPRTKGQLRGKCFHLMTSSCWFHIREALRFSKHITIAGIN